VADRLGISKSALLDPSASDPAVKVVEVDILLHAVGTG
jgi:hypothetical protein